MRSPSVITIAQSKLFTVYRIRQSNPVVSSAPLSEPSQKINVGSNDIEKGSETMVEIQQAQTMTTVYEEDEVFEWGEVLRGSSGTYTNRV